MRTHLGSALALGTLLSLAAAPARPAPAERPVLRFGVMAEEPNEPGRMLRAYADLIALLRQRLAPEGVSVADLVVARDLEDLSRRLRRGEVDVVVETVFPSLVLSRRSGCLEPGLVVLRRGRRVYRSVFFARKDDPIRTLEDLRGHVLVLQALRSTSAFALPRAELARAGLSVVPADDTTAGHGAVRYVLAGAEINEAVWVLHGRADAGAFSEADWAALPPRVRDRLRIFHETDTILRGLLSFRTGVDPRAKARLEEVLLRLHEDPEGPTALRRATGITRLERLTRDDRVSLRRWDKALGPIRPDP